jgi:hypothetical protein
LGRSCPAMEQKQQSLTSGHQIGPTNTICIAIIFDMARKRIATQTSERRSYRTMEVDEKQLRCSWLSVSVQCHPRGTTISALSLNIEGMCVGNDSLVKRRDFRRRDSAPIVSDALGITYFLQTLSQCAFGTNKVLPLRCFASVAKAFGGMASEPLAIHFLVCT